MKRGPLSTMVDYVPPKWQDRIVTAAAAYATAQYGPLAGDAVRYTFAALFGG